MKFPGHHAWPLRTLLIRLFIYFTLVCLGAALGYYLRSREVSPYSLMATLKRVLHVSPDHEGPLGHWARIDTKHPATGLSPDQKAEIEKLLSLGYAGGSVPRPRDTGVTRFDPSLADSNPVFFTSGHGPVALLMTREGELLNQWTYAYKDIWATNKEAFLEPKKNIGWTCWRRAHLFPNGDILAIYEGHGLVKLDKDSQLLWSYSGKCHHDIHVDEEDRIWVLTREADIVPRLDVKKPVLVDYVTILTPEGEFIRKIPLLEAMENSVYASFLDKAPVAGDIFHTNSLQQLDGTLAHLSPFFKQGNILTSMRELNVIAILDPQAEKIIWALSGMWIKQHEPTLLDNGHILIFDNLGHHGRSKLIEINPFTQKIVWAYEDSPEHSLFSETCGAGLRLVNGNTMIIESDNGRALEVTPEKSIVWEYRNPHFAGDNNEFIAAILCLTVLPNDFPLNWVRTMKSTDP